MNNSAYLCMLFGKKFEFYHYLFFNFNKWQ